MDRHLLNYLPPVLREVLEFQVINGANEPEISLAWDAITRVLANQFLEDADEDGVAVWEQELRLFPKDTDTLEARKARIKAKWNLELPYTLRWLKNWLAGLCGPDGHSVSLQDYTLDIQLDYTVLPEADRLAGEILDMLLTVRPENIHILMTALLQSTGGVRLGAYTERSLHMDLWPLLTNELESTGGVIGAGPLEYRATLEIYPNRRKAEMPDQERKYGTRITTAGSTLITNCILAGTKLKITQAAAGDGGGSYYLPSTEQTELVRELWRGPIVSAEQNASVPNMLDVKIIIDDSVGNFIVREMGLFDEDGTLIAICNTPDTEKVAISTGVDGRLTMLMHIVVVDSSVLEFTITPSLDTVSPEDLEEAIAEHNTDPASHPDIRQDITDAVDDHNTDETSHPDIRVDLSGLDSRLSVLELKYGTNVTGNSFEVTFGTLTGVVVTGVWNEIYARIEF